jgi:hypothetical protein
LNERRSRCPSAGQNALPERALNPGFFAIPAAGMAVALFGISQARKISENKP